jgi:hypothetical protein
MNTNLNKKILCEDLYKEYLELKKKTHITVQDHISGKPLNYNYINAKDLLKKEEIRQQLLDCKECLNLKPEEWFEIENG